MPTDMEMAEAVMETSLWLQLPLPGFTSDLQPASELPLAVMATVGSGKEGSLNGKYELIRINFKRPV